MNGAKVDEFDGKYIGRRKIRFSLLTGTEIRMEPGEQYHITVNQYGNAYIDDQSVGDVRDFEKLDD